MARQTRIHHGLFISIGLILIGSMIGPAGMQAAPQAVGTQAQQHTPKTMPPVPMTDQMTNISYYTLLDGMSSTLTLNNLQPTPTHVTVTIFSMAGQSHVLDPITLDPHSYKEIQLADVVPKVDFDSGNIEVAFNGVQMAVTCQVSIFSLEKRISFESREQDMMDFESANIVGILSRPPGADGFVALTNAAKNKLTVQLTAGSLQKTVALYPRQTQLIKLNDDDAGNATATTLVKLQHNGLPGDLIALGYVVNEKDGYSSAFSMTDPAIMHSSHLSGAHFRVGKPDPKEGFPDGTQFRSPLLLANVGAKPITAHVSVDYTLAENDKDQPEKNIAQDKKTGAADDADPVKFTVVALKDVTVAPGDVQLIELSTEMNGKGISDPIAEAGVDVDYNGPAGSLIGQLTSVDQTGDYTFEVPVKDPHAMNEQMSGVYPWTLDGGNNTTLHLKNTTGKPVIGLVLVNYPGGTYQPNPMLLKPYQTVAIDVQNLKDSQKPDVAGHVFPADAQQGQIVWYERTPYSTIGRAEQTNLKSGIAKSFSCSNSCCDNWNVTYYMYPGDSSGDPGGGVTENIDDLGVACGGYCFNMTNNGSCNWVSTNTSSGSAVTWSSDDTSIASVDSSGNVTFQGGGTTNINGTYYEPSYDYWSDGFCHDDGDDPTQIAQMTTLVPHSLSIYSNDSTSSEASCPISGDGTGCGVTRSFKYQVLDQNGDPLAQGGLSVWDAFSSPSSDGLNMGSNFTTTCTPKNTGPCAPTTDANGRFDELSLSVCAGTCRPTSTCTDGGGAFTQVTQTWHIGPTATINQTIKYYCDHVTVNDQ